MDNLCGLIDALTPWYLNGTASPSNRAQVEAHISQCKACRQRLTKERLLIDQLHDATDAQLPAVDAAWKRFETTLGTPAPTSFENSGRWSSWYVRGVIIAQTAAVAALAVVVVSLLSERRRNEPQFHTVTTAAPISEQSLRVTASPDISQERMKQIAAEYGGTVVTGPSPQGVFTIQLNQDRMRDRAIQNLRAMPGMLLVEPINYR